jgi:ABC-type proline/glycine betaine transport system ATPase subunit
MKLYFVVTDEDTVILVTRDEDEARDLAESDNAHVEEYDTE